MGSGGVMFEQLDDTIAERGVLRLRVRQLGRVVYLDGTGVACAGPDLRWTMEGETYAHGSLGQAAGLHGASERA